ncbi:MAG TPA: hypothetical protein DCS07_14515 [Bdellovibrionales bacterium]|nr:MAG: hypothetical protein A2X97_11935 [Bdellovibrionales bacterium GWA1_52_35]OFZ41463.1 MAG: hypothetical protein A2070_06500 [Bdellovibrionales bacterium GWC1_52_8]HAR43824.1 hypothetical protein [Bdellovibrionales bacterium]HCM39057.1 hypothetical protein [Bdellovibrionales bacterium]
MRNLKFLLSACGLLFAGCDSSSFSPGGYGYYEEKKGEDPAASGDVIGGKAVLDLDGKLLSGTLPLGVTTVGINGSRSVTIPKGYYTGDTMVSIQDSNLTGANLKFEAMIFSVMGSDDTVVDTSDANLITSDMANGKKAYVNGNLVTGSVPTGTNVTTYTNEGASTTINLEIPPGSYTDMQCRASDPNLAATRFCSGSSIFGVSGSATCQAAVPIAFLYTPIDGDSRVCSGYYTFNNAGTAVNGTASCVNSTVGSYMNFLSSSEFRTLGAAQRTVATENVTVYTNSPIGARAVPALLQDTDLAATAAAYVRRTDWDTTCDASTGAAGGSADSPCTCGLAGTLAQRVAHCASHGILSAEATWNGASRANGAQSLWKLVTRTGATDSGKGKEVWQDQRSGLLWSSLVATALNWCKATGSNHIFGNPSSETDPNAFCTSNTYQATSGMAVSACFEDPNFTRSDSNIEPSGLAALDQSSSPAVGWRIPTKYDYALAEVDGVRFVMPDMGQTLGIAEWAATVLESSRGLAFTFDGSNGAVSSKPRSSSQGVRCVGR